MRTTVWMITLFVVALSGTALGRQTEPERNKLYEQMQKELLQIRAELDSLKALPRETADDEIDKASERLEQRMQALENKIDAIARSSAAIVFNPRTTAFLNFAARADNKPVRDEKDITTINDKPFLRTVELDLRAPVDPYAEAVIIMSLEDEAGTGFSIDAEEAYGLVKRLPVLESAPLGMKLKVGKYRAPLGQDNKLHMHDLPWTTRPLVISKFLGTEHGNFFESGYNPVGMDFDFFVPNPIPGTTLEMNADVVRGGDLGLTQGHGGNQPAYLGHLNLASDWNNVHLLVLGLSGYVNGGASSTTLLGTDFLYKWAPSERRESRSFVVGGEAFLGNHTYQDTLTSKPLGWFAYAQYQLSYWLYAGLRYDSVEEPSNDKLKTTSLAAYASYYTTEFLRFRLGFEHKASDLPQQTNVNSVILEINFVFGSHPTEPYWVNR